MFSRSRHNSLKNITPLVPIRKEELDFDNKLQTFGKTKARLLPTIAENRQTNKIQAKELSYNINRFQHMISSQDQINHEEMIRNIFAVIKNFGEVDSNFKNLFLDMQAKLKPYLFLSESDIALKYRLKQGLTYKKVCKLMDKQYEDVLIKHNASIDELKKIIKLQTQQFSLQKQNLQKEIVILKDDVEKYKKMADVEYVFSLERKIDDLKEALSAEEQEYKILARKNEVSALQIQQLRRQIIQFEFDNSKMSEKIYDLSVLKDKTQIYLLNLKDRFEELSNRMESLKEIIKKVEAQNQNLVAQRIKLVNRAAVSFDDLTPRPKYNELFLYDLNTNINPTNEIMKNILCLISINKDQLFTKFFSSKKNRKLMECQAIREKTIKQIEKAQKEMPLHI